MDIKKTLQGQQSKALIKEIVQYIGSDKNRFKALMDLFFEKNIRLSHRASWAVGYCGVDHPKLIYPYLEKMIDYLEKPIHNAIKRNTTRILAEIEIPEKLLGRVADICFRFLDDPKEAIAVRVFSMSVCYNITLKEPELANELKIIIEDHYPHGSAGFKVRARRVLKALEKL